MSLYNRRWIGNPIPGICQIFPRGRRRWHRPSDKFRIRTDPSRVQALGRTRHIPTAGTDRPRRYRIACLPESSRKSASLPRTARLARRESGSPPQRMEAEVAKRRSCLRFPTRASRSSVPSPRPLRQLPSGTGSDGTRFGFPPRAGRSSKRSAAPGHPGNLALPASSSFHVLELATFKRHLSSLGLEFRRSASCEANAPAASPDHGFAARLARTSSRPAPPDCPSGQHSFRLGKARSCRHFPSATE